jgi:hypothetical protein
MRQYSLGKTEEIQEEISVRTVGNTELYGYTTLLGAK